ncbi:glutaryl-CoA dehydrogenase Acd [Thermodesulforhabdus norvegica]|uniref:Glutaryl-CoA dehydrogenase (Non-decarboxylating) n=1 Tax=Thermodesulforhabdus norvegica TaxID=39841 RepID=A0A1I4QTF4_9BACT|nr:glutaryl-CoA dehydrogenase Acd [Thermodesulforhabdus norvegica]SFM43311.1 glutaryl-CoA dehydrogenase (non-decarboxylating) [Thermodesulforhabdus norvegica]
MNFELTEEQRMVQEQARRFAEQEILPNLEKEEANHEFVRERVKKMGELGFFGCCIPEEYGGNGMGFMESVLMTEQIACVSPSWRLPFNMQNIGPALTVYQFGTEEQKRKYIPGWVSGEKIGFFAITEPNAGSDVAGMRTTAREDGDSWVLTGQKMWITNAPIGDVGLVYAYTDKEKKYKGMTCFIVDIRNTPGIETREIETKLGLPCSPTGEIIFDEARIPKDAVLGQVGEGFKICMWMLNNTRLSCAAGALGVAGACLEHAIKYANERTQFGQPISRFQMIQSQIAEMVAEHEAAKLLVYQAAYLKDQGKPNQLQTSIAKYYASEVAVKAANEAMKIFGSYGFSLEYPIARFFRDVKSYQIVEGTSNIQKLIIAGIALGHQPNR